MNAERSALPPILALQVKALGCDGNSPPSVPSWLDSLGLQDYVHSFLSSGYSSIDTVKNLWELELVNVSAASAQAWPGCCCSLSFPGLLPAWPVRVRYEAEGSCGPGNNLMAPLPALPRS